MILIQLLLAVPVLYGESGWLPRQLWLEHFPGWEYVTIHAGSAAVVRALIALELLAAGACALRATGAPVWLRAMVWALHVSLLHRNPLHCSGADMLSTSLLFWAMLIPLHRRWALRGLVLQMALLYGATAYEKLQDLDWSHGLALRTALAHGGLLTNIGRAVLDAALPGAFWRVATLLVLGLESLAPLLLLIRIRRTETARHGFILALIAFHAGILLLMGLWDFSLVSISGLLLSCVPLAGGAPSSRRRWATAVAIGGCLVMVMGNGPEAMRQKIQSLGATLGLSQNWVMFATLARTPGKIFLEPPLSASSLRTDKYISTLSIESNRRLFLGVTHWLCAHGESAETRVFFRESSYDGKNEKSQILAYRHCGPRPHGGGHPGAGGP
jgi:hypothetical protein